MQPVPKFRMYPSGIGASLITNQLDFMCVRTVAVYILVRVLMHASRLGNRAWILGGLWFCLYVVACVLNGDFSHARFGVAG